ncbi:MAG: hypothetical protein WCB04_13620 [Mycobacteriales bacterium]
MLVLTTFDRNEWVYEALRVGASGFLLKAVRASQLTDTIFDDHQPGGRNRHQAWAVTSYTVTLSICTGSPASALTMLAA